MVAPDEPGWELLTATAAIPTVLWIIVRRRGAGLLALAIAFAACLGMGALAGKVRATQIAAPILKEQMAKEAEEKAREKAAKA